jgi:peptide/nickel transport system ATP-binding protein/oligopeptide transport system ATP-binding protein
VGESGCGKSTLGRLFLRLLEPTEGRVIFQGDDLFGQNMSDEKLRHIRRDMQMIFQDPHSSLNPRMSVRDIVVEPFVIHREARGEDLGKRVLDLLETVGMGKEHMRRYPHELSGGQKQRVAIARALALHPKFVVLDEPTSALDVSVRSQILNLLADLQGTMGLTYLYISHDLRDVVFISDTIVVMYAGRIAEFGPTDSLFESPMHPYTQALFSSAPIPDPTLKRDRVALRGEVPSLVDPPSGCRFHPRCPHAMSVCTQVPELLEVEPGHFVSCFLYNK